MKWQIGEYVVRNLNTVIDGYKDNLREALCEAGRKHFTPIHMRIADPKLSLLESLFPLASFSRELIDLLEPHIHIRKIDTYAGVSIQGTDIPCIYTGADEVEVEKYDIPLRDFIDDVFYTKGIAHDCYEYPTLDQRDMIHFYELLCLLKYNEENGYCMGFYYDEFEEKNTKKA